jgi:hypothetical protein
MRKLSAIAVWTGILILILSILTGIIASQYLTEITILQILIFIFVYTSFFTIAFKLSKLFLPISVGPIKEDFKSSFSYDLYLGLSLFCFQYFTESKAFPIPIRTLVLNLLGAKLGQNTFPSGSITDPFLFSAGDNCVIGLGSILTSHAAVGGQVELGYIQLGNKVTIGAGTIVYPDTSIGDNSIVAGGSVVLRGTKIPANQIWAGAPAKFIKNIEN